MTTVTDLRDWIKSGLERDDAEEVGRDTDGEYTYVDMTKLNAAIDTLCEEFRAKRKS